MRGEDGTGGNAKDRLLTAADQFLKSPYVEVGISQILKEAGVQPPTLYHHFGDKEGLFVQWAVGAVDRLGADIASSRGSQHSSDVALRGVAGALSSPGHPNLLVLMRDLEKLERAESRERIVEAVHRAVYEPLIEIFLAGMDSGQLRRDPVHKVVAAFLAMVHTLRPGELLSPQSEPDNVEWVVHRFLSGFSRA